LSPNRCVTCSSHGECEAVCPKEISLNYIARINRDQISAKITKAPSVNDSNQGIPSPGGIPFLIFPVAFNPIRTYHYINRKAESLDRSFCTN
jgi:hypothetical protein